MTQGVIYRNRRELIEAGLHNHLQKGIGWASDGIGYRSIILSGGYEDDEDYGDEIIYTGDGGRDPKTGRQVRDQIMTEGNLSLSLNMKSGKPIYVIRGSGHRSPYSPPYGYAFAGKYTVRI